MIANIILFIYIFLFLFSLGFIARMLVGRLLFPGKLETSPTPVDYYILFGFVTLSIALSILSLFSRIHLAVHLSMFIGVFLGIIFFRKQFFQLIASYQDSLRENKKAGYFFLAVWPFLGLLILYSASYVSASDTALYHAQFIKWIQEYPVVPGLVLVEKRFGFNSHFHIDSAFFNLSFLDIRNSSGVPITFFPLNSFFVLLLICRFTYNIYLATKSNDTFRVLLYAIAIIGIYYTFSGIVQSPAPDIIVTVMTFYCLSIFIERFIGRERSERPSFESILLLSMIFVLLTFKLSAAMIALLVPLVLWKNKVSPKFYSAIVVMGILTFVPFLIRNVFISGWLIFPFPVFDIFDVAWKKSAAEVIIIQDNIKAWARIPRVPVEKVMAMPFKEWFAVWWKALPSHTHTEMLTVSFLIINLISPILFWIGFLFRKIKKDVISYIGVYLVMLAGVAFWFVIAPDFRFGAGFLIFNVAFVLAYLLQHIPYRAGIVIAVAITIWSFEINIDHRSYFLDSYLRSEIVMYPKQMPVPVIQEVTNINGDLILKVPPDYNCQNVGLPCSSSPIPNIRLRGKSLAEGFYREQ